MTTSIRVAAAADIHAAEPLRERIGRAFSTIADECDLVLLAGDLTSGAVPFHNVAVHITGQNFAVFDD